MRRHYFVSCALAAGVLLMPAGPATAQDGMEDLDLENVPVITIDGRTFEENEPDEHAPVRIVGDHVHKEREIMLSYRYKRMKMDGNRDGTTDLSTDDVLDSWTVAPLRMTMEMHMFGAMISVTDDFTMAPMIPYIRKEMDHIDRAGVAFTTKSRGIGDVRLTGLYRFLNREKHNMILNAGISFPTGSIDEKGATPTDPGGANDLPYPMQIGSGTYDFLPGLTYRGHSGDYSWGAQATATIRTGDNSHDYRLGNRLQVSGWGGRRLTDWASVSLRFAWESWGDIRGRDPNLNTVMVQSASTTLQGGQRADAIFGLNFIIPRGPMMGNRLALEGGLPVHQRLEGPQLETDHFFTVSWQKTF